MLLTIMSYISLIMLIVAIPLQIYLSKRNNKWLGLIFPLFYLVISIIVIFSIVLPVIFSEPVIQEVYEKGQLVERSIISRKEFPNNIITNLLFIFLIYNIPTIILGIINATLRKKRKKTIDLDKMNIQDL